MNKNVLIIIGIVAIIILCGLSMSSLLKGGKTYDIRITIPAGSSETYVYSDEEISPRKNKITIYSGKGLGDTEVILKTIKVKEKTAYEASYLTPGMPVEMKVEKGGWFKIGVNMQNPTNEDIDVYVTVTDVDLRIE